MPPESVVNNAMPLRPARWVPTVYFAEGLPFVTIGMVSVLMYKSMGLSDAQIAFWTTLVMWPWTLKPLSRYSRSRCVAQMRKRVATALFTR